jgi:hypothetical protein
MVAYPRPVGGWSGVYTDMTTYLFTVRPPAGYAACSLGASVAEIRELTSHDERFDQWLETTGTRS